MNRNDKMITELPQLEVLVGHIDHGQVTIVRREDRSRIDGVKIRQLPTFHDPERRNLVVVDATRPCNTRYTVDVWGNVGGHSHEREEYLVVSSGTAPYFRLCDERDVSPSHGRFELIQLPLGAEIFIPSWVTHAVSAAGQRAFLLAEGPQEYNREQEKSSDIADWPITMKI